MGRFEQIASQLEAILITDPAESARSAGLRYVSDCDSGITRKRSGSRFIYVGPDGKRITDPETLGRIRSLAIPPAWTDVWICTRGNGHLQATGRDARGRKQYRYHPGWRQTRDETKYHRMLIFGESLPLIRRRCDEDLSLQGLPRQKVLAAVVQLLERTLIRIGNEEYARANGSFGLTTMRDRHVKITGSQLQFQFKGKSGVRHTVGLSDRRLARVVKRCRDLPGQTLFQYLDDEGNCHTIGSGDVNSYLREISGHDFTAKDFRTWAGTVFALIELRACGPCGTQTEGKKMVTQAIESVSQRLGNTPAVCRKCYVHPAVLDAYMEGTLGELKIEEPNAEKGDPYALRPEECAVIELLSRKVELGA